VAGDFDAFADVSALLDLDECADAGSVADLAAIQVDEA